MFPWNWLYALIPLLPCVYIAGTVVTSSETSGSVFESLYEVGGLGIAGFFLTVGAIPIIQGKMPSILTGKDLGKKGTPQGDVPIPEALGLVSGAMFVVCMIVGMTFLIETPKTLVMFSAGLLSICFMMCLGFADDVLNLPWRYKLLLPTIASLPLLMTYDGSTSVILPKPIRFLFQQDGLLSPMVNLIFTTSKLGDILELGIFYKVYMGMMGVFCTNAINIYAGINGLEAGQAFVLGCAVLAQNLIQIIRQHDQDNHHLFSAMFMVPFLTTTLGLLKYNWYPSQVFVGDTFCYYAGMTFAVVGILGHFSKTLLLFFIPQILNFLFSVPQLFKLIPCPRHRLPRYNVQTGLLECSFIPNSKLPNLTLINFFIGVFGPMHEKSLCLSLLAFQILCCALGFYVRYGLSGYLYDFVG